MMNDELENCRLKSAYFVKLFFLISNVGNI